MRRCQEKKSQRTSEATSGGGTASQPPEPGLQTEASSNRSSGVRQVTAAPRSAEVASLRPGAVPAVLCISSQPSPCWILRVSVVCVASKSHPERILRGSWAWELGFHSSSCSQEDSGLRHPYLSAQQLSLDWASEARLQARSQHPGCQAGLHPSHPVPLFLYRLLPLAPALLHQLWGAQIGVRDH